MYGSISNEGYAKNQYFQHIDGLRALAVLSVILLHLDIPYFTGGFVGVDVFFVISGFLITNIIVKEIETTGDFGFLNFYLRRARRILPALFFVLLASFVFSIWLLNPTKFVIFGGSLIAAVLSLSNIFFYYQSGYFDLFSQSNPLLHTWSLGVEEQFYFLWPLCLVVTCIYFKKHYLYVISVIFLLSLGLNFYFQGNNAEAMYYLMQYRAFEFCIGAFIVWLNRYAIKYAALKEIVCMSGVILILYSVIHFNSATLYPSYNALLPTVGSGLIIYSGTAKYTGLLFRNSVARYLGLISYSLYLVHWPIIVFFKSYNENWGLPFELSCVAKVIILLLSLVIATFMYFWIEQPFRKVHAKNNTLQSPQFNRINFNPKIIIPFSILLLLSGVTAYFSKGWLWRAAQPERLVKAGDVSKFFSQTWGGAGFRGGYNYIGKNKEPSLVLMGDSHVRMLHTGIVEILAKPLDISVYTVSGGEGGNFSSQTFLPNLVVLNSKAQKTLDKHAGLAYKDSVSKLKENNSSVFILSADFANKINKTGYLDTHVALGIDTNEMKNYAQYMPFLAAIDELRGYIKGHKLVIIGDFPGSSLYDPVSCLTQLKWFINPNCLPNQPIFATHHGSLHVNKILNEYALKHEDVYFINPYDIFCKDGYCNNVFGDGTSIYSDKGHLSKAGSIFFISKIKRELITLMGSTYALRDENNIRN